MDRSLQSAVAIMVASLWGTFAHGERVTDALIAGYDFREGSGTTVGDYSDFDVPLDLTIHDPGAVSWGDGFLSLNRATIISSASGPNVAPEGTAQKIFDVIPLTEEITIEAWVIPANDVANDGPARIATMSFDPTNRNFTMGQDQTVWMTRLRTTDAGNNGTNVRLIADEPLDLELQHLVYTRPASGDAKLYVNALEPALVPGGAGSGPITGDMSNWNDQYDFALGNELTWGNINDRDWLGDLFLVAIYARALSLDEVQQNFAEGPTALVTPVPIASCDFDGDEACNTADIDELVAQIAAGGAAPLFDVNIDGAVNNLDVDEWLAVAATQNGFASPYLPGDADLSGTVDVQDLNAVGLNWQQPVALWSSGDFSANGTVGSEDLNILALSWQDSIAAAGTTAVPEPSSLVLWFVAAGATLLRARRREFCID